MILLWNKKETRPIGRVSLFRYRNRKAAIFFRLVETVHAPSLQIQPIQRFLREPNYSAENLQTRFLSP